MKKIITHSGEAHFDEFFAISLILALVNDNFTIERRMPTEKEIIDLNVFVVDTGLNYNPDLRNFDHHQYKGGDCSFVLVARYFGLESLLNEIPWWNTKNMIDTKGPIFTAKTLGTTYELFGKLFSPIESFTLEMFAEDPCSMIDYMRNFGMKIINNAKKYKDAMIKFSKCQRIGIGGRVVLINESYDNFGSIGYAKSCDLVPSIMVSWDDKGPGWSIYRFFDNPEFDLYKLKDDDRIEFAHFGGFIAKTKERLDMLELLELIREAIVDTDDRFNLEKLDNLNC